jgi:PKD repeat protein
VGDYQMSKAGSKIESKRISFSKRFKSLNKKKQLAIILVEVILLVSLIPVMSAEPNVQITLNIVDQYGNSITASDEKIFIDNYGWFQDGDMLTVESNEVIYYRGYYSQGSGLYGIKKAHVCSETGILNIQYVKVEMNFIDQEGITLSPPTATDNERVYIDDVGYKANGDIIIVPDDATLYYRALYQTGSGLSGPKLNVATSELIDTIDVEFITFETEFTPGLPYTGNEVVFIDHVGYKYNNDPITLPKGCTIYYRMYFQAGKGLYGSKHSLEIESGNIDFIHNFRGISLKFIDQSGYEASIPIETGNERVYIDHVGYKAKNEILVVPDDAIIHYRAYYNEGSSLSGPKLSINVESLISDCEIVINPFDPDLIGYWQMDEDDGSTIFDSSVFDNHGTNIGGTRITEGISGNALSFNGIDEYIEIQDTSVLEPSEITVETWIKTPGTSQWSYIIGKGDDNGKGVSYALYTIKSGGLAFFIYDGTKIYFSPISETTFWDNEWHQIVGTFDGSYVRLFIDGSEVGTGNLYSTPSIQYSLPTIDNLFIGRCGDIGSYSYFNGIIDEVSIWSRALSLEEIQNHYNSLSSQPIGQWFFDEGLGSTVYDDSQNDNHGSIIGASWNEGRNGDALYFDGMNDNVGIVHNGDFDFGIGDFTIILWTYLTFNHPHAFLGSNGWSDTTSDFSLDTFGNMGGTPRFIVYTDTGNKFEVNADTTLLPNQWTQICVMRKSGTTTFYLNGVQSGSSEQLNNINIELDGLLLLGARGISGSETQYLNGKLDQISIWDRAITLDEIIINYNSVPPEPISQWQFDEGSGIIAEDAFANNNDGTIYSANWATGVSNDCLDFDGTNDYINIPDDYTLDFGPSLDFSIGAWFKAKPDQVDWQGTILSKLSPPSGGSYKRSYGYSMMVRGVKDIDNEGKVGLWIGDGDGSDGIFTLYSDNTYDDDLWHHAVATVDRDGSANLYIDGSLVKSVDISYMETLDLSTSENLELGREGVYDTYYFNGKLDEITLWNEVLSNEYILELYSSTLPGPVTLLHLDEGIGATANDATNNNNDGTLNGTSWSDEGILDHALEFDGIDDYVEIPDSPSLDTGNMFTIEAWFKTHDVSKVDHGTGTETQTIVMYGWDPDDGKNNVLHIMDGKLYFAIRGLGPGYDDLVGTTQIVNNRWYHTALTYDGITAKLYLNGELEDSQYAEMNLNSDSRVFIGRYQNPAFYNINFHFDGNIDEVAIWSRPLSGPEVQKHFEDNIEYIQCGMGILNVEFVSLNINFIDQYGELSENPDSTGNERIYMDHVGYKSNNDIILVPKDSTIYYRALYQIGSGLYGPKHNRMIDGTFNDLDVQFKSVELNFEGVELTGNERLFIDHVGWKANSDCLVVPMFSTIYYRAYFNQGSSLYGPKLDEYIDCDEDILDIEYWAIKFKIVHSGTTDLVTGAKVFVDSIGYVTNGGIVTVPMESTIYNRAIVGNTWSAKTSKLVDKTWNLILYEWDGVEFHGPSYFIEVTFNFYDQNNILNQSPAYTGNETVYVNTLGIYVNEGECVTVDAGRTVSYTAYYKRAGLHGPRIYTTNLVEHVMFQTAVFEFENQYGELGSIYYEKVYVNSVGTYFENDEPITVPLDSTISYTAYYTTGGLHGPRVFKAITETVEIIKVNYQTFSFEFKDQYGNDLAGTSNERVYVNSIGSYMNDGEELTVPLDSTISYTTYYTIGGLHGPRLYKTIDNSIETIEVVYQVISFEFKDQYGKDLIGTGNERVYVNSIGVYVNDGDLLAIPLDSTISYTAYYTISGLHGPRLYKKVDATVESIEVVYQVISFEFKDQYGNDLIGTGNERVYVNSIGVYVNDGDLLAIPLDSTISYTAYYTISGLRGPRLYNNVDDTIETVEVIYQLITFEFKDQHDDDLVGTGNERVYVNSIGIYINDGDQLAVPVDSTISFTAYYSIGGLHGPRIYENIDSSENEVIVVFQLVMFDFKDLAGEDLEGTGNEFVYVYSVTVNYVDGDFAVFPVDSVISYQAYFSIGEKSGEKVYETIGLLDVVEVTFNIYNNRPPVADAGPDQEVEEGEEVEFDASGTMDPDIGDILTYEWDFGDGSPTESGEDLIAPTHTYSDNGIYTVTLNVIDDHLASDVDVMTVTVTNVAPICIGTNNGPVSEGGTATISISSVYDPGADDTFSYYFDWDNDMTWEISGSSSPTADYTWYDNSNYQVRIGVEDDEGGMGTATTTVEVINVAPTADITNNGPKNEGETVTVSFNNQNDPGTLDTFMYSFDWDNDGIYDIVDQTNSIAENTWYDNGIFIVKGKIADDDGGYTEVTTEVIINNVAPTAELINDGPQNEGCAVTVSFINQNDPGTDDTFLYSFDWESDDIYEILNQASPSAENTWYDNGLFTVKGRIQDDDGGYSEYTTEVTINNVAPTADLGNNGPVSEGSPVTVSFSNQNDPGTSDTFTYSFDWDNDGIYELVDQADPWAQYTWFDNGLYTVGGRIKDNDGGYSEYTTEVTVVNVVPTAVLNNNGPIDEGSPVTVSFSDQTDPGTSDTFTYSFDWNNDGTYDIVDQTDPWAQYTWYDNGEYTVGGMIKDNDGGFSEYTTIVTIQNVAPTGTLNNNGPKDEACEVTIWFSDQNDPGTSDTFTYSFDWDNDGIYEIEDQSDASATYTWYDNGIYTVQGRIKDNYGDFTEYTTDVTINNVAPTASFLNDGPKNEGEVVTFSFSNQYDPGTSDTFTYSFDWNNDGIYEISDQTNPSAEHTWNDNGLYTVRGRIKDNDNGYTDYQSEVTINNVAPSVYAGPDGTINEGDTFVSSGYFTDPGSDTWSGTVDYGDGSSIETLILNFDKTFDLSHIYSDNGEFNVTVTIKDDDSGTDSDIAVVTVNNVAPTVDAGSDKNMNEGSLMTGSGSFTDPGSDTWTGTIDYGDGTGSQALSLSGKSFSFSHVYADNGVYTVTITITDNSNDFGVDSIMVTVNNVAPVLSAGSDQTVNEGEIVTLDPASFNDKGTADTHTALIDWGDGTATEPGSITESPFGPPGSTAGVDGTISGSHVYADNGAYTVTITIEDDDGGLDSDTFVVTVLNVAPTLTPISDMTVYEGDLVSLPPAEFNDAGTGDTHTSTIDWGDATSLETGTVFESPFGPPGSTSGADGTIGGSHVYSDNGKYMVTITVKDDDGLETLESFEVTVINSPPTVNAGPDRQIDEGELITLESSAFNDLGTADTHTATINWGDGTTLDLGTVTESPFGPPGSTLGADGTISGNHVYADNGVYTVTIMVLDDDGAYGSDTFEVTVTNVAPTIDAGPDRQINEGELITLESSTFNDLGTADTHTASIDWGDGTTSDIGIVTESPFGPPGSTLGADGTITGDHVYADNGIYTVLLTIYDDDSDFATDTILVTVNNVAPTITTIMDTTSTEGSIVTLPPAEFNDMGTLDTHIATINWGDGTLTDSCTVTETPYGPPGSTAGVNGEASHEHIYADNGIYTVLLTITDDDGGFATEEFLVTIMNIVPTVYAGSDQEVNEGDTVLLEPATFNDLGTSDTHTATIDWGDGTVENGFVSEAPFGPPGSTAGADGTVAGSHIYSDNGIYLVTVSVFDDDGGSADNTFIITVLNVAPSLDLTNTVYTYDGYKLYLENIEFTDPGTADTHTATIDWDDVAGDPAVAATVVETDGSGTISGSHQYTINSAPTIVITVLDDDGGSSSTEIYIRIHPGQIFVDVDNNQLYTEGVDVIIPEELVEDGYFNTNKPEPGYKPAQLNSGLVIPYGITIQVPKRGLQIRAANRLTIGGTINGDDTSSSKGTGLQIKLISSQLIVPGLITANSNVESNKGRCSPKAGKITILNAETIIPRTGILQSNGQGPGSRGGVIHVVTQCFSNDGFIFVRGSSQVKQGRTADGGLIKIKTGKFENNGIIFANAYSSNARGGFIVIIANGDNTCDDDSLIFLNSGLLKASAYGQRDGKKQVRGGMIRIQSYGAMDISGAIKAEIGDESSEGPTNSVGGKIDIDVIGGSLTLTGILSVDNWGENDPDDRRKFPKAGNVFIDILNGDFDFSGTISSVSQIGANGWGGKIDIEVEGGDFSCAGIIISESHGPKADYLFPKGGIIYIDVSNGDLDIMGSGQLSVDSTNPNGANGRGGLIVLKMNNGIVNNLGTITADTYGDKEQRGFPRAGGILLYITTGNFNNEGTLSSSCLNTGEAGSRGFIIWISVEGGDITNTGTIRADSYGERAGCWKPKGGQIKLKTDQHVTNSGEVSAIADFGKDGSILVYCSTYDFDDGECNPSPKIIT